MSNCTINDKNRVAAKRANETERNRADRRMSNKKSMMAKRAEETEQQKAKRKMSNKLSMMIRKPSNKKLFVETLTKLTKELRKVTVPKRSIKFETKKLWHLNEHQLSR